MKIFILGEVRQDGSKVPIEDVRWNISKDD